jgi:putative ABC transport system substrate-binding protein
MSICLRRREFIAGLGGAAAWPLAAGAQQPRERMRRIGVLSNYAADHLQGPNRLAALPPGIGLDGRAQFEGADYRWRKSIEA